MKKDLTKCYKVTYESWYGINSLTIPAPNKTTARAGAKGELNSNCKIISIDEIK